MSGLQGLTGLEAYSVDTGYLTPVEQQGGPANPVHGQELWDTPERFPSEYVAGAGHPDPAPTEMEIISSIPPITPAGRPSDDPLWDYDVPDTHAAPWPKGIEQAGDRNVEHSIDKTHELADIHASDLNASAKWGEFTEPSIGAWENYDVNATGSSGQVPLPGQVGVAAAGFGSTDSTQNPFTVQNDYDFDAGHVHRRVAHDPVPGNYLWLQPKGRPIVINQPHPAQVPVGSDSPFAGQDPAVAFSVQGAIVTTPPTAYQPPAEADVLSQPGPAPAPGPVEGWF